MSSEDQHEYNAIRALVAALAVRVVALEELVQPLDLGSSPDGEDGDAIVVVAGPDEFAFPDDDSGSTAEVDGDSGSVGAEVGPAVRPLDLGRAGFDRLINSEE